MATDTSPEALCERVNQALRRNGMLTVTCENSEKGFRLGGFLPKAEDRAVAYALARTTIGVEKISNAIEISK